jgi:tape measure domain-containing protein
MAKAIETLSIKLDFKDAGVQQVLNKVKSSFKGLEQVVSGNTKPAIQKLRAEINGFAATGNKTISTIDAQVRALRALRREADINSKEFKELTSDISKFEKQLGQAQGRRPGAAGGGRALAATQIGGAVVSGGIFGGPEGAVGALTGAALGGVPGAFAGAAVGAQVGMVRQSLGGVAETVAEINSMKIALAGVSESAEDYQKSFANVISISKQFLFPVNKAIGEFTKLKAAVVGAGFGTQETTDVFKGFAAAILATGGDAEKLSGALLAASQAFSKGKVQAEELRGQIGERLPGAFTTFAQSIGVSSRDLDEMLRKGEVSTENFVEFTRTLFSRYEKTAEILGDAPEKAGQRLELALSLATLEYGGFFQKVGAGFQDYLTTLVNFATSNKQTFINIAADVAAFSLDIAAQVKDAAMNIATPFIIAFSALEVKIENLKEQFGLLFKAAGAFGKLLIRADGFDGFDLPPSGRPSVQERASAIRSQLEGLFSQFQPASGFGTSLGDTPLLGEDETADGTTKGSASKKISAFDQIYAKLTKQIALEKEINKFEKERIRIRVAAGEIVSRIDEQVADNRKQELFDLAEILRVEALRTVDAEERESKIKEAMKMDFAGLFKQQQGKLQEFIASAKESLEDLQQVGVNVAQGLGNAIANSLVNGVQGLMDGSQKAKDVFANLLKSVGQILASEGAKMIATYIAIGIAKAFAGLSGGGGKGFMTAPLGTEFSSGASFFEGGFDATGLFTRANGGPVNAGRPYMVGERGPELFIPGSNGGIMRNEDMRSLMGRSPASASVPQMNFSFETTNIGGTEYVSREQLEAAMATTRRQAANDGARRGMNMTIDKMRNSPRTRSSIGIG